MDVPTVATRHPSLQRLVQFPLTRIFIATVSLIVVVFLLQGIAKVAPLNPDTAVGPLLAAALTVAALIAAYVAYVRLIERRPATYLGTKGAALEFTAGFMLGGFLFGLVMLILWLAGVAVIGVGGGWRGLWIPLLSALELGVLQALSFAASCFGSPRKPWEPGSRWRSPSSYSAHRTRPVGART